MKSVPILLSVLVLAACSTTNSPTRDQAPASARGSGEAPVLADATTEPNSEAWLNEVVCRREHTTATRVGGGGRRCMTRLEWQRIDRANKADADEVLDRGKTHTCRDSVNC